MSGSIEIMASEIRCLLFQKPRQFNCIILSIMLIMGFRNYPWQIPGGSGVDGFIFGASRYDGG